MKSGGLSQPSVSPPTGDEEFVDDRSVDPGDSHACADREEESLLELLLRVVGP